MVSSIATLYKKLRLETHENLGWGKIHLPERSSTPLRTGWRLGRTSIRGVETSSTSRWPARAEPYRPWLGVC